MMSFLVYPTSEPQLTHTSTSFVEIINRPRLVPLLVRHSPYSCGIHSAIIPDPRESAELRQFQVPKRETRACHKERNVTVEMSDDANSENGNVSQWMGTSPIAKHRLSNLLISAHTGLIWMSPKSDWWCTKKRRVIEETDACLCGNVNGHRGLF